MTPLQFYFEQTKSRAVDLARLVGCSPSQICRLINGEKTVRADFAERVADATGGTLSAEDFIKSCMTARKSFLSGIKPKDFRKQSLAASVSVVEG